MKILLINQFCSHGSTGRICTDLQELAIANGDECCIAYGRYSAPEGIETYKVGSSFNVYEHVFESRFYDNDGFASRHSTRKFVKFIKEYNPDVIHIHNLHGYYVNSEILMDYLKKTSIRIIWTFHDCWPFSPRTAYIDYDENGNLPKRQTSKESKNQYPKSYFNLHDNYMRKRKTFSGINKLTIVTPSNWLKRMVKETYFKDYDCVTIHNGIDLSKFKPTVMPSSIVKRYNLQNKKVLLSVANVWDDRKGLRFLNDLSHKIDDSYKIVVIGKIADKNESISEKITHIERTDSVEELSYWYTKADYFLNPTLFDNFPTTNLEALACGTPVITFDTGGSGESIDHTCGKVIREKNADRLYLAITDGREYDPELCIRRSKMFEKEKKFQDYIKLYHGGKL
ncbi:glycosyltransferase [Enterococcus sp. AZ007]|uniref:glycosyltransferase n=1 Tax=Enterococcus sp. AZ007 TaxID=2774839 RepID=UPI003F292656